MKHMVVAPSVGESITEVGILKWHKQNGEAVKSGEVLLEIESDKATVEVSSETSGQLSILKQAGERIPVGEKIAEIDDSIQTSPSPSPRAAAPVPAPALSTGAPTGATFAGPAARKIGAEKGLDLSTLAGTGKDGRVTKGDVLSAVVPTAPLSSPSQQKVADPTGTRRVPMSLIRKKTAERLVYAQHTAAILCTFNEVDMTKIMALRAKHKDAFKAKYGTNLGFMSFFTKGAAEVLKQLPGVNGSIEGDDILYHDYCDIGVAVGTDRGLVVPVIRGAEKLTLAQIETTLATLATKARDGKLSIKEMTGGTFTISNGGVYGSLLSTPILNPPQTAILGMHKIQERPVALNGKIEIRPMMYLALSYDHRLIDGKEAVTFLVTLKELLENPEKLGLEL